MTREIYLIRHAQTIEKQGDQKDIERDLTSVGLQNATRMGINFKNKKVAPDIIISSPATRAFTTARLMAEQINYEDTRIHLNDEIYNASIRTLLQVINQLKDQWQKVMIIGHNPSVSYLVEYLTGDEVGDMSTCGVAHMKFKVKLWSDIGEKTGSLVTYEYPDLLNF